MIINWILVSVFLIICAVTDLKCRLIHIGFCYFNMLVAIVLNIILKNISFFSLAIGLMLTVVLYFVSYFSHEKLGMGDVYVTLVMVLYVGMEAVSVFWIALVFCLFYSLYSFFRKRNIKEEFPFVPFLFIGEIATIALTWQGRMGV